MNRIVAIGEEGALDGFVLTGVEVVVASRDGDIMAAWEGLGEDVGLIILSNRAAQVLGDDLHRRPDRLSVVAP